MNLKALLATVLLFGAPLVLQAAVIVQQPSEPLDVFFQYVFNPDGSVDISGGSFGLDIDDSGSVDVTFVYSWTTAWAETTAGNSIFSLHFPPNHDGHAIPLPEGTMISGDIPTEPNGLWFSGYSGLDTHLINTNGTPSGTFVGQTGFIGVRFQSTLGAHFGWVLYEDRRGTPGGRIHAWGYEWIPEQGLLATAVPEPAAGGYLLLVPGSPEIGPS